MTFVFHVKFKKKEETIKKGRLILGKDWHLLRKRRTSEDERRKGKSWLILCHAIREQEVKS